MERKGSYSKMKESSPAWLGPKAERTMSVSFFLNNTNIIAICISLTIISLSGVGSFRLLTAQTSREDRGLLEDASREPTTPFRLGPVITDWDEQRSAWLEKNPHMKTNAKGKPRMFMITGSQAKACANPMGDFWLLKAYKNKMDYCRLHNIESYYSMGFMDPAMVDFWVKLPLIRKMMLAHPEAEWIWWMDSDAMFTDMAFEIPLEKYADHNMIVHGWPAEVFEKKNWVGLNAGIFLVRNCQWTLDFLDIWASLGEERGNHRWNVGKIFTESLSGRLSGFPADDQSALIYLLTTKQDNLFEKVYLENTYYLHGFWVYLTEKYEENMANGQPGFGDDRWPFITHFVGCKLCGNNNDYPTDTCLKQMSRAFNFADNQVIHDFGFLHESLESPILHRVHNFSEVSF